MGLAAPAHQQLSTGIVVTIAVLAAVAAGLGALHTGLWQAPLPYPAIGQRVHRYPRDVLPWQPQPQEGDFTPNNRLQAVRMFAGLIDGSESVIAAPDGRAVMLDKFGGVFEAHEQPGGSFVLNRSPIAWLGPGRPLGAAFDAEGNLIVCDALKGLLKLDAATRRVELLTSRTSRGSSLEPDSAIIYMNDLDISPTDGMIYFTSSVDIILHRQAAHDSRIQHVPSLEGRAGFWDTVKGWGLGMTQGKPRGKLYSYNPATKQTHLLATGFWYSNGLAISADGSFLVISETDRLRLLKYWLRGPRAGSLQVLIDHMPGTPDGVARAPDGNFWFPLLVKVPPATRHFHHPLVRSILPLIPETWRPLVLEWGAVVKIDGSGNVLEFLEDPQRADLTQRPSAYRISSAHEDFKGRLWLGNLVSDFVSYVDLTSLPPAPPRLAATWRPSVACFTPPCEYARPRWQQA